MGGVMLRVIKLLYLLTAFSVLNGYAFAEGAKMDYLGMFDAGQQGVSIYKMFDKSDNVICYILMPEVAGRRPADIPSKWIYEGNTIGSISCVKTLVNIGIVGQDLILNSISSKKK